MQLLLIVCPLRFAGAGFLHSGIVPMPAATVSKHGNFTDSGNRAATPFCYSERMATNDKYTSNWRGARRYQFDEEARLKRVAMASGAQPAQVKVWPIDTNRDRDVIGIEMGGKIASGKAKDASILLLWAIPATLGAVLLAVVAFTITGDFAR